MKKKLKKRPAKTHTKKARKRMIRKCAAKSARKAAKKNSLKFNPKELLGFKKLINKRKDEVLDDIKHISEDTLKKSQKEASGDISGYTYHMADVATDTYDREFSLSLASSEREVVYELNDALKKIDDGLFGICEECKGSIAKTRLKAVPYARLCVKCQEKKESR